MASALRIVSPPALNGNSFLLKCSFWTTNWCRHSDNCYFKMSTSSFFDIALANSAENYYVSWLRNKTAKSNGQSSITSTVVIAATNCHSLDLDQQMAEMTTIMINPTQVSTTKTPALQPWRHFRENIFLQ